MTSLRVASSGAISRSRLWIVAAAFLVWGGLSLWTLHGYQIVRADEHRARARRQQECLVEAQPTRGKILDRTGRPLAVSADAYTVYAAAERVRETGDGMERLAKLLEMPLRKVRKKLSRNGFILMKRRLAPDVADTIRAERIPGVELINEPKRFYPRGALAAHVLGFVVADNPEIREGLELRYDDVITGTPGTYLTLHDAQGRHILLEEREKPIPGKDVVTSLDEVVQHIAERELAAAIRSTGARAGSVVVLHTPTGEVLAMANRPSFNPNRYGKARAAARRNRAVTDLYEPGSTFKMVTAAAAIEEGLVRSSEAIYCGEGQVQVAGKTIRDHKPFGVLSFRQVIERSSNGCAVKVGLRLHPDVFYDYITRFGFGQKTGVDLPGETRGLLRPTREWSRTSQAYISFGQEVGVNALQIAAAFSAIANRGVYVAPRVVRRILDPGGAEVILPDPAPRRRVISEATARILVDLMESTVYEGTGVAAAVEGYRVAGKTGTAQKVMRGGSTYSEDHYVASFAGFVPVKDPVLTIHVVLDSPRTEEYHGGDVAAPVFAKIAAPVLDYLDVPREPGPGSLGGNELAALGAGGGVVPASSEWGARSGGGRSRAGGILPVEPRRLETGIAAGPPSESPEVPDLTGVSLRDAVVGLARAGLKVRVEGEGFVVVQHPPAGTAMNPGGTVFLKLARSVRLPRGAARRGS